VGVGVDLDDLEERAFLGVAGDEGGCGLAAFESGLEGAEVKAALLLHPAVAFGAVLLDEGMGLPAKRHAEAEEKEEDFVGRRHKRFGQDDFYTGPVKKAIVEVKEGWGDF